MNSAERVLRTIRGKATDRIPRGEIVISPGFIAGMAEYDLSHLRTERAVLERLGADLVVVDAEYSPPQEAVRYWRSESDLFVFVMVQGPLWASIENLEWQGLFRLMAGDLPAALGRIEDFSQRQVDLAMSGLEAGAQGVIISDDLAGKDRTIVSPSALRKTFFPSLSVMQKQLNQLGVPVVFHSDGNIKAVLRDLAEMDFSAIHGLEPSAGMDIINTRPVMGDTVTLWGNLEFEGANGLKSAESVATEAHNLILENCGRGRYIFGSNTGLYDNVPPELALAAYDAAKV